MRGEEQERDEMKDAANEGTVIVRLMEEAKKMMNDETLDEETTQMVERLIVLRIATKHINLWMRQLEMKKKEMCELAELLRLETVKNEIEAAKDLEKWGRRANSYFTKKVRRAMFGEIDNMVWSGSGNEVTKWCKRNKVYDKITEEEIEEIWKREDPEEGEPIRLNGKCVGDGEESL